MAVRLRHVWGQRPLARKWAALLFVFVGLVSVGVAYAPSAWVTATGDALAWLQSAVGALSFHEQMLMVAAALLTVGLVVFLSARPRRYHYDTTRPSMVAPVSVYLDAENQLLSPKQVKAFIPLLRKHLGGRRADLIYYTDARRVAHTPAYLTLYRFGFRPVDVPHAPVGVEGAKNIVDVELALHAYQRALLGPPNQEVILVTTDRDYLPLMYRLRAMEHTVGVWADEVSDAFKDLQEYVGIQVVEFGSGPKAKSKQSTSAGSVEQHQEPRPTSRKGPAPVASLPVSIEAVATLTRAVSVTVDLIRAVSLPDQTAGERFALVKEQAVVPGYDVAGELGYTGKNRVVHWLAHLRALGVVNGDQSKMPLGPGPVEVEAGAKLLERFLHELAHTAEQLTSASRERRIRLTTVCRYVTQAPYGEDDDPLKGLRKHLRASLADNPSVGLTEMQGLCRSAKTLGLLWYDETPSPNLIIVSARGAM